MILDFNPKANVYVLKVDRKDPENNIQDLMQSHGLDFSLPDSTGAEAVLFTREPYCAATFHKSATPRALQELKPILVEIESSWQLDSKANIKTPYGEELWGFQKANIEYALKRKHTLIGDQPGLGKAQPLWAKVLTPKGWVKMGDIKLGQNLCTSYGKSARVVGVYDRGVMDVFKFTFNDGATCYASIDHLWKVRAHGPGAPEWFHAPTWELQDRLARGQRLEIPLVAPHQGIEGPPLVSAYLLGILLGDGCVRGNTVKLSSADPEIVARCKLIAKHYGADVVFSSGVDWRFNKVAELRRRLSKLDIMGHKAQTKRVPHRYLHGNRKVRLEILQGLMDSDGWCCSDGNNTGFASTSEGLADDVIALVRSLGGIARKIIKKGSWSVTINMAVCPFWLKRKADKWHPYKSYVPSRWLKKIEKYSTEPVRCISVASKDRLYITDDYVVTHNTPTAICFANEINAKRVLVICPANIRLQWVKKIRQWTTLEWPYIVHPILNGKHGVHPTADYTVVSYDLARTPAIGKALAKGLYDVIILDEAHYCKTIDSRRTRAIFGGGQDRQFAPLASRAGAILALTGTPLPNRPREAYTLIRGLCWDAADWASEDSFKARFNPSIRRETICPKTGQTKIWIDERSGRHAELQNRMRGNFMTRHLKREVMPWLKMPQYDLISVEETKAVKQALQAESLLDIDPENLEGADAAVLGHIAVVRKQMGIALAPQVADYIDMLIDGGEEKLVVFAWHIEVLNILEERFRKHGVLRIDGSTSATKKQKLVDEFIKDPRKRVIVGNILSMGTGTDGLQDVAGHGLIAEPDWTPGNNIQCFDRLDRGLQTRTVQGDIFVAPGSFAERILASALRKNQIVHKALDRRIG